jgi:hypothetical protein
MPRYDFRVKGTEEVFEKTFTFKEYDDYLRDNPNVERIHLDVVGIGDPVSLGIRKIDGGMKEVLQRIKAANPGSRMNIPG